MSVEEGRLTLDQRRFADEQQYRPTSVERWFSSSAAGALITGLIGMILFRYLTKPWEQRKFEEAERSAREKLGMDHEHSRERLEEEHTNALERLKLEHKHDREKLEAEHRIKLEEQERVQSAERRRLDAERERMWDEVGIARSTTLLEQRTTAYRGLWSQLARLPIYPLPEEFTYQHARELQAELKKWYFEQAGGMYLTLDRPDRTGSRTAYLGVQAALVLLVHETRLDPPGTPMIPQGARISPADVKADEGAADEFLAVFTKGEAALPRDNFERYRLIRALGSRLRTAMANDIGSRSALAGRDTVSVGPSKPA